MSRGRKEEKKRQLEAQEAVNMVMLIAQEASDTRSDVINRISTAGSHSPPPSPPPSLW